MLVQICLDAIGVHADTVDGPELCLMLIGLDQPIGNCVVRDSSTGRYVSLTQLRDFGRIAIGTYIEVRPEDTAIGVRTARKELPAPDLKAAFLVVLLVAYASTKATKLAKGTAQALLHGGVTILERGQWAVHSIGEYIHREFIQQWKFGVIMGIPVSVLLTWIAVLVRHR
jgi:hypothetical protein